MAEVNNVIEKIEKVMDAVESKTVPAAENSTTKDAGNSLNNSHDEKGKDEKGIVDAKSNGKQEEEEKEPVEAKIEEKIEKDASETGKETKEEEKMDTTTKPTEELAGGDEKSAATASSEPATDVKESEQEKEKSPEKEDEEEEDEESEEKKDAATKPKGRGRGAPRGKRAKGRRGKAKTTNKVAAAANVDEAEDDEKKDEEEAVVEKKEEAKTEKKEEEKETKAEEPKAPAKRGGRKRAPTTDAETAVAKLTKADDSGSSGASAGVGDDKKTPLLETPLIIEGKRQRQKVERLDSKMLATPLHSKDTVDIPQGSGTKLGDIPYIEALITKTSTEDLKPLHRLCFGRAGATHEIRKHMRSFSGFDFEKGTDAYVKKNKQMNNWGMKQLKKICEVLGLERGGKKEELETVVLDFLIKPADAGKKAPQGRKRKSAGGSKKRGSTSGRGRSKKSTSGEGSATSESGDGAEEEESGDKDEDDKDDEGNESEPEPPKAKRGKKNPPKKAAPATAASTSKKTPRGKAAAKKTPPTDEALKAAIKDLLQGANLEEITMRDMCKQVFAKYPDFDLNSRKEFIKGAVKAIISASTE